MIVGIILVSTLAMFMLVLSGVCFSNGERAMGIDSVILSVLCFIGLFCSVWMEGKNSNNINIYTQGTKIQYGGIDGIIKTNINDGRFAIEVKGQIYIVEPDDVNLLEAK